MKGQIRVLRRLFLKVVLRGATGDGLPVDTQPVTVPVKLLGDMIFFAVCGLTALYFLHRSIAALGLCLHAATFVVVGVFFANAAADVLANPEEAMALSYFPVTLQAVVAAKALVLGELALWIAGAFNLAGLGIAAFLPNGSWRFIPAHVLAIGLNVMFALGCVLVFHRYRVFRHTHGRWAVAVPWVIIGLYAAGLGWALNFRLEGFVSRISPGGDAAFLFPPAWFAGIDGLLARSETTAWPLAVGALVATASALALGLIGFGGKRTHWTTAFASRRELAPRNHSRLLQWLVQSRLANWGLDTPASRAAFTVTALYLARNRDLRFRVLAALVPVLASPLLLWLPRLHSGPTANFWTLVVGIYLTVCAFLTVQLLETSSDWRAAQIFHHAPLPGPGELYNGARRAALVMAVPLWFVYFAALIWLIRGASAVVLLVPAIVAVPLFARLPNLVGRGLPLTLPPSSGAGQKPLQVMSKCSFLAVPIAALFACVSTRGFWILVALEAAYVVRFLIRSRRYLANMPWAGTQEHVGS